MTYNPSVHHWKKLQKIDNRKKILQYYQDNFFPSQKEVARAVGLSYLTTYLHMSEIKAQWRKKLPPPPTNLSPSERREKILELSKRCPGISRKEIERYLNLESKTLRKCVREIKRDLQAIHR